MPVATRHAPIAATLLLILGTSLGSLPAQAAEKAVPAEHNPPGDIPDTQVFITYHGPGFAVEVPGRLVAPRHGHRGRVFFNDKYNIIEVMVAHATLRRL